jgi:hypothetical protein
MALTDAQVTETIPACVACRYHYESRAGQHFCVHEAVVTRRSTVDVVYGTVRMQTKPVPCTSARLLPQDCGVRGRLFTPRIPADVVWTPLQMGWWRQCWRRLIDRWFTAKGGS